MKKLIYAVLISGLSCSLSFAAITYTAIRGVGSGTANISITTDGTIGVLNESNIIDWNITVSDATASFTLLGPLSGGNSAVALAGTDLTATSTNLLFNFDSTTTSASFLLIQSPYISSGELFYSVQVQGAFDPAYTPAEGIDAQTVYSGLTTSPRSGNMVIASAIPEPSSLALCMLGALGLWFRRRQR